jgi:hypothetical protein
MPSDEEDYRKCEECFKIYPVSELDGLIGKSESHNLTTAPVQEAEETWRAMTVWGSGWCRAN